MAVMYSKFGSAWIEFAKLAKDISKEHDQFVLPSSPYSKYDELHQIWNEYQKLLLVMETACFGQFLWCYLEMKIITMS